MQRPKIKNLVIMLALVELLSTVNITDVKANDSERTFYMLDKNGKVRVVDDERIILNHGKTFVNDWDTISIFNEENTISHQFGGNQSDFMYYYSMLIKDPYIWEEMQKYFPVSDFSSIDEANDFYELYFTTVANSGCGYISIVNSVFQTFEGKEKEFEEIFGFPMYIINEDNSIDFNYEILTLKLFNYAVLYPNYDPKNIEAVKAMYTKSLAFRELVRFEYSPEYQSIDFDKWKKLDGEEQKQYVFKINEVNTKYYDLKEKYDKAKNIPYEVSFNLKQSLKPIQNFFAGYGITLELKTMEIKNINSIHPGDIICSDNFDLYKEDHGEKYSEKNDLQPHAVYVVSVENGKIIVSSWGERFIFDDTDIEWIKKIVVDFKTKKNIKSR